MTSPEVLDFATLLAPIAGDHPTGTDVRADFSPVSLFQMIKADRTAARDAERQAASAEGEPAPAPQWPSLIEKASRLLADKSKDLEVTAYLIEGLTRKKGLAGLRDGFRLARELLEQHWDGLYPSVDPDSPDVEDRFSHLLLLGGIEAPGTLIVPIRMIPFTESTSQGCFKLSDYFLAKSLSGIGDAKLRQKKIDEGAVTIDKIAKAVSETSAEFYGNLVGDLQQSQEEIARFAAVLSEKSGYDPSSSFLREALEEYLAVVKDLARDKIPKEAPPAVPTAADADATTSDATTPDASNGQGPSAGGRPGAIAGREDALQRLEQIAAYFRKNDPQSIIPYALEQVITWGRMPLPELLAELIPEEDSRRGLFKKVGIKPAESKS